jgi:hypothetical protein
MFVVFAFLLPHVAGRAGSPANLGAILLALPAFAATWIGHSAERLQQSSVTTIAGLAATGAISIAGSVLYMSQTALWNGWTFRDLTMLTIPVPSFDLPWFLLGLSSVVVTTVLGTRWRHRMDRYVETLRRRDPTPVPNSASSG